jgi:hypothetical protein
MLSCVNGTPATNWSAYSLRHVRRDWNRIVLLVGFGVGDRRPTRDRRSVAVR